MHSFYPKEHELNRKAGKEREELFVPLLLLLLLFHFVQRTTGGAPAPPPPPPAPPLVGLGGVCVCVGVCVGGGGGSGTSPCAAGGGRRVPRTLKRRLKCHPRWKRRLKGATHPEKAAPGCHTPWSRLFRARGTLEPPSHGGWHLNHLFQGAWHP